MLMRADSRGLSHCEPHAAMYSVRLNYVYLNITAT